MSHGAYSACSPIVLWRLDGDVCIANIAPMGNFVIDDACQVTLNTSNRVNSCDTNRMSRHVERPSSGPFGSVYPDYFRLRSIVKRLATLDWHWE